MLASVVTVDNTPLLRTRDLVGIGLGMAVAAFTVWMARVSLAGFQATIALALVLVGYAALRWPRGALLAVALSAIFDRYVIASVMPAQLTELTHLTSEAMLVTVSLIFVWQAWRADHLISAFRHPASAFLGAFLLLGLLSAAVNHDPALQVFVGLASTLDAVVLFFLVRMVGFTLRQALVAVGILVAVLVVASMIAILQALIGPDVLGLSALTGRFGETYRLGSIFGDPNVFAALISAAIPFAIVAAVRAPVRWHRRAAIAMAWTLALALALSFSRGGWLGMVAGFAIAALIMDRRALLVGAAVVILGFGTAYVMPRNLGGAADQPPPSIDGSQLGTTLIGADPGDATDMQPPDLVGSTFKRVSTVGTGKDLRTLFILNALPIVADHPLLGVGPGRYGGAAADILGTPVYAEYGTDKLLWGSQRTVDDFWLHLFVEGGVLGFAAFATAIGVVLIGLIRRAAAASHASPWSRILLVGTCAAACSLAINSLTTMLLEANSVAFVFWFLLGIGSAFTVASASVEGSERPRVRRLAGSPQAGGPAA